MHTDFLKQDFLDEARKVFGEDYERFLSSYEEKPFRGISVNTLKISYDKIKSLLPFEPEKSPLYLNGYYINSDIEGLGNSPIHHAGGFYVQEPSASAPVTLLDIHKGDRVLDLCAAPGGKSSQIAALLDHSGLLWSNEIVKSRSQILLSNLERMGVRSAVISNCSPEALCDSLKGFFDKVLVDAPCSGEGMFRKNPKALDEWSREQVRVCAERQLSILESAAEAVRAGGSIVYSTCTFSQEENEGVIDKFLQCHDEFYVDKVKVNFGRKSCIEGGVRISPLEGGEGQFMIRLVKKGSDPPSESPYKFDSNSTSVKIVENFLKEVFKIFPAGNIEVIASRAYLFPNNIPKLNGLGVIRAGVLIGEIKKNRIEPAHALFSAFPPEFFNRTLDFSQDEPEVMRFLRGEEIDCCGESGYTLFAVEGISCGFGKCSGGRLKNKYPKGLRI